MDLIGQMKNMDMFRKFLREDVSHMCPYPFIPQKPPAFPVEETGFSASAPEKEGIPSSVIESYFRELDGEKDCHPHSVMILRHGKLIARGDWAPYTYQLPHAMYSFSKSVVSLAVGIAKEEGLLSEDDLLTSYYPYKPAPFRSSRMGEVTLRHLLTMTSGAVFAEAGSVAEKDWIRGFLMGDCAYEPGTKFSYNSMNTYMLSAVLRKVTGVSLTEYLTPRLYEPLGMKPPYWETCPMGIEKGGWGLYLTPPEMAKLGQLMLQKGRWKVNGKEKQLVPAEWIETATDGHIPTGKDGIAYGYGYQFWSFEKTGYQFSGMFGQRVVVLPRRDMVIAITAGSQEIFTDRIAKITASYFGEGAPEYGDGPIVAKPGAHRSLRKVLESLEAFPEYGSPAEEKITLREKLFFASRSQALEGGIRRLDGKRYRLEKTSGAQASLLPMLISCLTNNFPFTPSEAEFHLTREEVKVMFTGPGGEKACIFAGLDGTPRTLSLTLNGEPFWVGASARLALDEDSRLVLKICLSFLETPCAEELKCIFYEDEERREDGCLLLRFREMPDAAAAGKMLSDLFTGEDENQAALRERIRTSVRHLFEPKLKGKILESQEDSQGMDTTGETLPETPGPEPLPGKQESPSAGTL